MPSLLVEDMYAIEKQKVVTIVGIGALVLGVLLVLGYLSINIVLRKISERSVIVFGYLVHIIGIIILLPFGNTYPKSIIIHKNNALAETEIYGCHYNWCEEVPAIRPWQLILGHALTAIATSSIDVPVVVIYSKLIPSQYQGVAMGILVAVGTLGTLIAPIILTQLYAEFGPRIAFLSELVVFVVPCIAVIAAYKRLKPKG